MRIAGKNTNVNSGFSLVFLSVVILIMGAIMTAVIGLYNVDNIHRRTFETTNRFKVVDTAIASYLAKYGKLPCPAPLNCNTEGCINGQDRLGIEKRGQTSSSFSDSDSNSGTNCVADGIGVFETVNENKEKILYGNVPAASLGLANNYLVDAWGNKMVYMVPEELTQDEALKKITYQKQVFQEEGAESVDQQKYLGDGEVFMLMSFNVNTPGAFSYDDKKSSHFDKNKMKLENLPVNNFKVNKNNTQYLYYHKKLEGLSDAFGSDKKSSNTQPDIGEPDCEEITYTYSFIVREDVEKYKGRGSSSEKDPQPTKPTITPTKPAKEGSKIGYSRTFNYTGKVQAFTVPDDVSEVFIEAWGARGGHSDTNKGGEGGYSYGYFDTTRTKKLYVYVGGKGGNKAKGLKGGGWNGGGQAAGGSNNRDGAGGGASDVRTIGGSWYNINSLKSRIIVAGGGGGASHHAVKCFNTFIPERGGYGGGGNNKGGRGMGGYSINKQKGVCGTNRWAAGGGIGGDNKYYCKSSQFLGRSYYQGGGGYYGGGSNVCSGFGTPGAIDNNSCSVDNTGGCGSGGGGSGYIKGVSNRKTMDSSIGPGKSGGQNGRSCDYEVKYHNWKKKTLKKTIKGVGCDNLNYTRTYKVSGIANMVIKDGEGKVRITYVGVETPTEPTEPEKPDDQSVSKTYEYTITFPKTKYGEEVSSLEECPKLVYTPSEPLDYFLFSTNRDVNGRLINNRAVNVCERGGKWKYERDDYEPENPNTGTRKCIILPKCKKPSSLNKYKDVFWNASLDNFDIGSYNIVNTGTVSGVRVDKNNKETKVKLRCVVKLSSSTNCGNNMSCYANTNNYTSDYYEE